MNCCNRTYGCVQCHNLHSDHEATKENVKTLICLNCGLQQSIQGHCLNCQTSFGKVVNKLPKVFLAFCKNRLIGCVYNLSSLLSKFITNTEIF